MNKLVQHFFLLSVIVFTSFRAFGQKDTILPYELYDDKLVLYTDLGFNSAPSSIIYPFNSTVGKLKLRNNYNALLGLGFSYKWLSFRFSFAIPGASRAKSRYGTSNYYNLGFDFSLKRFFFDIDLQGNNGYAFKNAYKWNDSLNKLKPNIIREDLNTFSFSLNTWHFFNDRFKMQPFRGSTGAYTKDIQSIYLKYTFNVYSIYSDEKSIIPVQLIDSTNTKTISSTVGAVDLGILPGFAYIKRLNDFQIGAMGGFGVVVQSKFYRYGENLRNYIGLAPRYDLKLIAGYNKPKYFVMLITDFDNKSFRFNELIFRQTYYSMRLVGGIRLGVDRDKIKLRRIKIFGQEL
jgi:hypothetical protein